MKNIYSDEDMSDESSETQCLEQDSESDPDLDCDNWDDDCVVLPKLHISKAITGFHLMPTCCKDPELHPSKRRKIVPEIRTSLTEGSGLNRLKECWFNSKMYSGNGTQIIVEPFKVCVIDNFLQNSEFLIKIWQEFSELDWNERNMDLYEFFQSNDLKHFHSGYIHMFHDFLKCEVLNWVSNFMEVELTSTSATCSLYTNTDYLLVHDDQREDRLIAFVLYLTGDQEWYAEKGGALQLLSSNESGYPTHVVRDILPAYNQLVLFPVTNKSHHQIVINRGISLQRVACQDIAIDLENFENQGFLG